MLTALIIINSLTFVIAVYIAWQMFLDANYHREIRELNHELCDHAEKVLDINKNIIESNERLLVFIEKVLKEQAEEDKKYDASFKEAADYIQSVLKNIPTYDVNETLKGN